MEFTGILGLILEFKYPLLILITAVEGPVAMLAAGFLIQLGLLSIPLSLGALVLGDLLGDTFWYMVGYFARHSVILRFGKYFGISGEKFEHLENVFKRHALLILIISKLTMGLGFSMFTLMAAGSVRIKYLYFLLINALAGVVWTAFLMSLGYYFGNLYLVAEDVGSKSLVVGIFAIVLLIGFLLIRFIRTNINKKYLD